MGSVTRGVLLAGLLLSLPVQAQSCGYVIEENRVAMNPCDEGRDWSGLDIFLGVLGILITVVGAIFALVKVRQRRATVGTYLKRVEATYAKGRNDPPAALPDLVGIRSEVRRHYTKGRLEDAPYLELEKRITQYIGRLRLAELERAVPSLPAPVRARAEGLLADGIVSPDDVEAISAQASRSRVANAKRTGLVALFEAWARDDEALMA